MQVSSIAAMLFIIITIVTVYLFYKAANKSKSFLIIICCWIFIQSIISSTGFYKTESSTPPHFSLLILPPVIFIIILFITKKGRLFINNLNIQQITLLHTIRVFVETGLYMLFISKSIPQIMTFEGRNFDIFSGITAPIIYYFIFIKRISFKFLTVWNFLALALLINIIVVAMLSLQTPFQQLGFGQPNIGLTFFPFIFLPSVIVPIVLLSHLAALRQLLFGIKTISVKKICKPISL